MSHSLPITSGALALAVLGACGPALAQPGDDIRELKLKDWQPRSMLVVPATTVDKPRFPAIDVHNHLGAGRDVLTAQRVAGYLEEMNEAGVQTVVNLDGGWGDRLQETLARLDNAHPGRFLTFAQVDFTGFDDPEWSGREAARLTEGFNAGAKGLKFHKLLGLGYRHQDGTLIRVDDPKLDPIFETCAAHRKPVMIHTADPAAFFTPLDRFNERWHELNEHPNWLFHGKDFPPREELLAQFIRVVEKHPRTNFIGAHFGNNVEDLATVGQWLERFPNLYVDIDARISELGRQPYTARDFFLKHQDRILFGTDTNPRREAFRIYYRFLETRDEYFDCAASHHLQGFWMIYGIDLPDGVLEKIYHKNAERILYADGDADSPAAAERIVRVGRTADFHVTGNGSSDAWAKAEWQSLERRPGGTLDYTARFKMLYSGKGVYVLMQGTDRRVTATLQEDFADLWNEDVFEFFFWPDERQTMYFEYEISPLNHELPILVPNVDQRFLGWRPWHYEGARKIQKVVSLAGGKGEPGARIEEWTAEVFVPYDLLKPLGNVPPRPASRWRANFYRVDYDDGQTTGWDWSRVGPSFHEFEKFGTIVFE
jgi:predicted TIM-barrel fold metal-dependent hydrolase